MQLKGKSSHKEITGRPPAPLAGRYHVAILHLTEMNQPGREPALAVEFQVLKGTTPGQEGTIHTEFFTVNDKQYNIDRLTKLAMVIGILGANEDKDVDLEQGKGRQLIIELFDDEYQGKKKTKIKGMGMWPVGDPDVSDVPIDQAMLAAAVTGPSTQTAAAPAPTNGTPAAAVPATAPAGADWDV